MIDPKATSKKEPQRLVQFSQRVVEHNSPDGFPCHSACWRSVFNHADADLQLVFTDLQHDLQFPSDEKILAYPHCLSLQHFTTTLVSSRFLSDDMGFQTICRGFEI